MLEAARGELESTERMLQQAEVNLQNIERNPSAAMVCSLSHPSVGAHGLGGGAVAPFSSASTQVNILPT